MEKKKRPKPNITRSAGRLAAVQGLYRIELSEAKVDDVIKETLYPEAEDEDGGPITEADRELMARVLRGAIDNQADIDSMIDQALKGDMSAARLEALLRVLLRAAITELAFENRAPVRVVIDEYLNVAHAFFDAPEARLVNGVLDRIAHVHRTSELDKPDSGTDA
jgi:N utilization substance protein B